MSPQRRGAARLIATRGASVGIRSFSRSTTSASSPCGSITSKPSRRSYGAFHGTSRNVVSSTAPLYELRQRLGGRRRVAGDLGQADVCERAARLDLDLAQPLHVVVRRGPDHRARSYW